MKIQFIDTEMLCWLNGIVPQGQTKHIIQIGLVEIESKNLEVTRRKSYYVRPKDKNFEVSEYCTNLTGINRSMLVDNGRYFSEAMKSIQKEFSPGSKQTFAWGSDYRPISEHCSIYDCPNPWAQTGIWDFGVFFRGAYNYKYKMPLVEALKFLGLPFEGKQHNAEYDALALAHLHNEMMRRIRGTKGE